MDEQISTAITGGDKHETYAAMLSRHNIAMKYGFCLEALLIDYAMLEDRLAAFLWAAGALNDIGKLSLGNRRNKAQLLGLYTAYTCKDNLKDLKNISAKTDIILAMIGFAEKAYDGDDRYLAALHRGMQEIDMVGLKNTLTELQGWCKYRNEIIHGAMTKNIYSLNEGLVEKAVDGLVYARMIDNESKKLKRRKYIRRSVSMTPKK